MMQGIENDKDKDQEETRFLVSAGSSDVNQKRFQSDNGKRSQRFRCSPLILLVIISGLLAVTALVLRVEVQSLHKLDTLDKEKLELDTSQKEAKAAAKELADFNIESVKKFEAASQTHWKQERKMLCLKPDPTALYFNFSSIPTILISKEEMDQERRNGNVFPPITEKGRSGNRIIEIGHELDAAIACNKMVTPLTKDFANFFIPCFDFRPGPTQNKTKPDACQSATSDLQNLNGNPNDIKLLGLRVFEGMGFETNTLSTQLLNYHLGNAKGWFVGQKCREQPVPTIILHLRSGDIMRKKPHSGYGQPPLEYYVKAVEHSGATNIIIFSEDMKTPLADALKNYQWNNSAANHVSNVTLRSHAPFDEVIYSIMCAEMVVCARSSLCRFYSRSANLRTIYCPTDTQQLAIASIPGLTVEHIWKYDLGNQTYSPFAHWKNSPEQREEMLTFRGGTFEPV